MTIVRRIHTAISDVFCTPGSPAGHSRPIEKFTIGVDYVGWGELGAEDDTVSLEFSYLGKKFRVVPIKGLAEGSVAFIWP